MIGKHVMKYWFSVEVKKIVEILVYCGRETFCPSIGLLCKENTFSKYWFTGNTLSIGLNIKQSMFCRVTKKREVVVLLKYNGAFQCTLCFSKKNIVDHLEAKFTITLVRSKIRKYSNRVPYSH